MYSGRLVLYASAAERCCGIRGTSDVSGLSTRSNLVYKVLVLCQLAQLEVASHYFTVACFELVTEFLDGVLVDECASCFAFCVDSVGNVVGILSSVVAGSVDVAVDTAAAVLHSEAEFRNALTSCVEAVTESIGDTAKLSIDVLGVKAFEEVGTSECALYCGIATETISSEETAAT